MTIKNKVNIALRLSDILGLSVMYNSSENLYFIKKSEDSSAIVPGAKNQEAIMRYLKENHPEVTL